MIKKYSGYVLVLAACWLQACSPSRPVSASAANTSVPSSPVKDPLQLFTDETLLQQPGIRSAQVGISLYDPAAAVFKFNYQGDKYFIPASNTKLFSLYAGLKYLGDALVGMRYRITD